MNHEARRAGTMFGFARRVPLSLVVVTGLFAALAITSPASASDGPTCFGKRATIVASGEITGTARNDVIVGSEGDDLINGAGGNDLICSLGGTDILTGGLGNDLIDGGSGDDAFAGDLRSLTGDVSGNGGNDLLHGGDGNDRITGDNRSTADGALVSGDGG